MDLTRLVMEVRQRMGADAPSMWYEIIDRINQAVKAFNSEERWPWLYAATTKTLAAGASDVTLPNDIGISQSFNVMIQAAGEDEYPVSRVTAPEGARLRTTRTNASRPLYYYPLTASLDVTGPGDETLKYIIRFVPKADKEYTVSFTYLSTHIPITEPTQEPNIPEEYQDAIIAHAAAHLWMAMGKDTAGKIDENIAIYQSILRRAQRNLFRLQEDESLVWGKEADEFERFPLLFPGLPQGYGVSEWPL